MTKKVLNSLRLVAYSWAWLLQKLRLRFISIPPEDRLLHPFPRLTQTRRQHSARRLNQLLAVVDHPRRYLEIGIEKGWTLQAVSAHVAVGVDPHPRFHTEHLPNHVEVYTKTSDEYFEESTAVFDVIFLDGLHTAAQTYKDFCNATHHLAVNGFIVIDDVLPSDEYSAIPDQQESEKQKELHGITHRAWYGDVYKVLAAIAEFHPTWNFVLLGGDGSAHGQAVVWQRGQLVSPETASTKIKGLLTKTNFQDFFETQKSLLEPHFYDETEFFAAVKSGNLTKVGKSLEPEERQNLQRRFKA